MIDDRFIAEIEGILPLVYDDSLSYYEVLEKVTYLLNECLQKINNIADPVIYTPTVNEDGTISWTNNGGLPNPDPVDISGPVGPAPSMSVTDITGGHRITIIDEDHPDGINIDVMNGAKGEQGDAGVSPTITITDVLGGHRITITDKEHPQGQSFNVMNGTKGDQGDQGDAGVSPTVTITDILGGYRITITDKDHPQGQNFDVMNGAKGDTGEGVPAGGTAGQVLAKISNTDNDTGWIDDIDVKPGDIGITITGARPSMTVTAGQYVVVRNSTISGITDGLYTANTTLSPSTDVTAANLTAVSGGGLNSLKDDMIFDTISMDRATVNATSSRRFSKSVARAGYKAIGIIGVAGIATSYIMSEFVNYIEQSAELDVYNFTASAVEITPIVLVLYKKG